VTAAALAGSLALVGGDGLMAAGVQRLAAIEEAEKAGDPELTARVIGGFAVPAIWTRSDDPAAAARIVAAAERALAALPADTDHDGPGHDSARARLLATIALESRGSTSPRPREAAAQAQAIARRLVDPALLCFALNGVWMQAFWRTGLAAERDAIGDSITSLATRHGLAEFEILGRLIRMQALSALGDFAAADAHAAELDRLGERHERPGVGVFTGWYRAMRRAADSEEGYRAAARLLDGCGMPGVEEGLLPLALLCRRVWRCFHDGLHESLHEGFEEGFRGESGEPAGFPADTAWGPYEPWARPWMFITRGRDREARDALRACPEPPRGLLAEALWCLTLRAAVNVGDQGLAVRARDALRPAAGEIAAGSGVLTGGPVRDYTGSRSRRGVLIALDTASTSRPGGTNPGPGSIRISGTGTTRPQASQRPS
jgi:hypothetical protein